jgi:hypothetical protein
MLQHAQRVSGNVSQTCRFFGVSWEPLGHYPSGLSKSSIGPGDVVTIYIHQAKTRNSVGRISLILFPDGTELLKYAYGVSPYCRERVKLLTTTGLAYIASRAAEFAHEYRGVRDADDALEEFSKTTTISSEKPSNFAFHSLLELAV